MEPPVLQEADPVPSSDEKNLALIMHVLSLVGFGIISTLIIWLIKKDESAFINKAGKEHLNFQISVLIYALASGLLSCIGIGILMLIALGVAVLVLGIIGLIRATEGKIYRYPAILRLVK
ncbi:MAG: DUF4870 domain-containing protein [Opitutales bacterium]